MWTNLIVNYLPQNMSQEEIKTLFGSIGEMHSCKLVRDKANGQSLGYGFVNYKNVSDALKALETLNGLNLQNKRIKVSVARPSSTLIKGANLYVGGIPRTMTELDLRKMFAPCGNIITLRILYDSATSKSRGVGFVRYDTRLEAETAIKQLNGLLLEGKSEPLIVKFANNPSVDSPTFVKQPLSDNSNGYCLLVENLAGDLNEVDVWQLFGPYGAVKGVQLLDNVTEISDGNIQFKCEQQTQPQYAAQVYQCFSPKLKMKSALVKMSEHHNALVAKEFINGICVRGKILKVDFLNNNKLIYSPKSTSANVCYFNYNFCNNAKVSPNCGNNASVMYYDNGDFQRGYTYQKNIF